MLKASSIIHKKREGNKLSKEELSFLIKGFLNNEVADYQMSAFLMAVFFKGMDIEETINLTQLMLDSGDKLNLSKIKGFKVDKHSTGGVGDKLSLILAPIVASYGIYVPMISGRGLGFTGGTLDKLESIPGFNTKPTVQEFERIVSEIGLAIIGQTDNIVPADKKMYALRDVTATVESNPLICSSILSKKFAEDIDALVMDLKVGRGAFMKDIKDGILLAKNIISISHAFGKKATCILTNMNAPLGFGIGNWLEVAETVHCLRGWDVPDVMEVTHYLAGAMLSMGGITKNIKEGIEFSKNAITSGKAYEKFLQMVSAQGGDISYIENLEKYKVAKYAISVKSDKEGYISSIDALKIGLLGIDIGIGRLKTDDKIDYSSGIVFKKKLGDIVDIGDELAICYTEKEDILKYSSKQILESFTFMKDKPMTNGKDSMIISVIGDINPE